MENEEDWLIETIVPQEERNQKRREEIYKRGYATREEVEDSIMPIGVLRSIGWDYYPLRNCYMPTYASELLDIHVIRQQLADLEQELSQSNHNSTATMTYTGAWPPPKQRFPGL